MAACPIEDLLSFAGMPEEMQIVYHAVARRYAVLVVGPDLSGTSNFCYEETWPPEGNGEIAGVRHLPWHAFTEWHCDHAAGLLSNTSKVTAASNASGQD